MDFQELTLDALIDSGALVSYLSETDYAKIQLISPKDIIKEMDPLPFKLQVANGDIATPTKIIMHQFEIGASPFSKATGNPRCEPRAIAFSPPHILCRSRREHPKQKTIQRPNQTPITILPETTQTITVHADVSSTIDTTGVINPATNHCNGDPWYFASSISTASNWRTPNQHITPSKSTRLSRNSIFNIVPRRSKRTQTVKDGSSKSTARGLFRRSYGIRQRAPKDERQPNLLVPTPDNPEDPKTYTPIQSRKHREIQEIEEIQKVNPTNSPEERETFLKSFNWNDSQMNDEDKKDIEETLIEYNDIFARHRLDIGINHEFKI